MEAAAGGDDRALEALCARHRDDLHRYLRSMLRDAEDAQDALQATLMKAVAGLRTARPRDLRAWLFTIAHREAIDIVRRRRPHAPLDADEPRPGPGVHELVAEREELAALLDDLAALPERQRSALLLRELAGLDHRALARALGVTEVSARHAVYEARRALARSVAGRSAACEEIRLALSDGDGRRRRGGHVRAHLRACAGCREFDAALRARPARLRALLAPLSLLGGGGGAVAGKTAAVVATVAVLAGGTAALREAPQPGREPAPAGAPLKRVDRGRVLAPPAPAAPVVKRRARAAPPAPAPARTARAAAPATSAHPPAPPAEAVQAAPAGGERAPAPAAAPPAAEDERDTVVATPEQGAVPETSAHAGEDEVGVCVGPCEQPGLPLP